MYFFQNSDNPDAATNLFEEAPAGNSSLSIPYEDEINEQDEVEQKFDV